MKSGDGKKTNTGNLVVAGRVGKAWGIRGQLSVSWNNGSCPLEISTGRVFVRKKGNSEFEEHRVLEDRPHGNVNVVKFEGLDSRNDAENYGGAEVWVDRAALPALGKNEYYAFELLDARVETLDGEYLGEIKEIFSTGSNDVYVVRKGREELLVPAIQDVIKEVSVADKIVRVELLEGLR